MTALEGAPRRRGWYHGWNIVAVCILALSAANGMPVNAFSLFLRDWSADLHTPISSLQLGVAAFGVCTAALSPFVGILADKYPARWLLGSGLMGIALFYLGVSFVIGLAVLTLLGGAACLLMRERLRGRTTEADTQVARAATVTSNLDHNDANLDNIVD
jgi:MFS family permease